MKPFRILAVAFLIGASLVTSRAASPDDEYAGIYNLIRAADQSAQVGQKVDAREQYGEALRRLEGLGAAYPNWNANVIKFRLRYIRERLEPLGGERGTEVSPAPAPSELEGVAPSGEARVQALEQRVVQLESERAVLNAKLREAWQARPAALDPKTMDEAEKRIEALERERDLLKVALRKSEQSGPSEADPTDVAEVRRALEAANQEVADHTELVAAMRSEVVRLQNRNTELEKEKALLTTRLASVSAPADTESERVTALARERDELARKLADATRELYRVRTQGEPSQFATLTNQVAILRARLEVFEAKKVPYTNEELALMKEPALPALPVSPDGAAAERPRERRYPSGAAALLAEADHAFRARRYEDAERLYLQILRLEPDNVFTLGDLSAIAFQLGKDVEAEGYLKQALAAEPNDAYSNSRMGVLRFRQQKFEEALDYLSRAAQLNSRDPETQAYLGSTLDILGYRSAAETALRKAIQLAPGYAEAHFNLSVVYATQKPAFLELARWHYQKALANGHASSPDVEALLAGRNREKEPGE